MMEATTIAEVIDRLEVIILQMEDEESPLGYFPALYQKVTKRVQEGIERGEFEDGPRMERLDVIFANRYLVAFDEYRSRHTATACWICSFEQGRQYWPIVLQHLVLGMNAHINLDLAIAAARTAPGDAIFGLEKDFAQINTLLASLVEEVQQELARIWPMLTILLKIAGKSDNLLVDFSMEKARTGAWKYAVELAHMDREAQEASIRERDGKVAKIGDHVGDPGFPFGWVFRLIRLRERGQVRDRIRILRGLHSPA